MRMIKILSACVVIFSLLCTVKAQTIRDDITAGKIPLPSDAQEVRGFQEKRNPAATQVILYMTNLNKEQLIRFYARELAKRGWSNKESLLETFNKNEIPIRNQQVGGNVVDMQSVLSDIIQFSKNNEILMLFIRSKFEQQKTLFSLSYISMPMTQPSASQIDKSLPDTIPAYPNKDFDTMQGDAYVFQTTDDILTVASFYKIRMPISGWSLLDEGSLEQEEYEMPLSMEEVTATCPNCSGNSSWSDEMANQLQDGLKHAKTQLRFINNAGQKCFISLSQFQHSTLPQGTYIVIRVQQ